MRAATGSWDEDDAISTLSDEVFVSTRVVPRLWQLVAPRGGAHTWGWRAVAAGCIVSDVTIARWLRGRGRGRFAARLLLDAADVALWSSATIDDGGAAQYVSFPGMPLASEAGARYGLGGMVVPLVNAAAATAVRRWRGQRARGSVYLLQVTSVLEGMASVRAVRQQHRAAAARRLPRLEAELRSAGLAGRNAAATSPTSPVDEVRRLGALVHLAGRWAPSESGPAGAPAGRIAREATSRAALADPLGQAKTRLGEGTRSGAIYLGDALMSWARARNRTPALAQTVWFDVTPDAGTQVLDRSQATQLRGALDRLSLRGEVAVSPAGVPDRPGPSQECRLVVDGRPVTLRAERPLPLHATDPLPTALLRAALILLPPAQRSRNGVPLDVTLVPVAALAALACSAQILATGGRSVPRGEFVAATVAAATWYTWRSPRTMRYPLGGDGNMTVPSIAAVVGTQLVAGAAGFATSPGRRVALSGVTTALCAVAWLRTPDPKTPWTLFGELLFVGSQLAATLRGGMARRSQASALSRAAKAQVTDEAAREQAFRAGWDEVQCLLVQEIAQLRATVGERAGAFDADVRTEIERRFVEIDERLAWARGHFEDRR